MKKIKLKIKRKLEKKKPGIARMTAHSLLIKGTGSSLGLELSYSWGSQIFCCHKASGCSTSRFVMVCSRMFQIPTKKGAGCPLLLALLMDKPPTVAGSPEGLTLYCCGLSFCFAHILGLAASQTSISKPMGWYCWLQRNHRGKILNIQCFFSALLNVLGWRWQVLHLEITPHFL